MPFPQAERVIYNKNPLQQVICQLKYNPILTIDSNLPADFQDRIRYEFPFYEETSSLHVQVPESKIQINQAIDINPIKIKTYVFMNEDKSWRIDLSRETLLLSTKKYSRWEEFFGKLQKPLSALDDIYKPSYLSSIDLRYVDLFKRSTLGLNDTSWNDLIDNSFTGLLCSSEVGSFVRGANSVFELDLANGFGKVRISSAIVIDIIDKEDCFMLDSTFFIDKKIELKDVGQYLNIFNKNSTNLLRYAVKEKLHDAMEPDKP